MATRGPSAKERRAFSGRAFVVAVTSALVFVLMGLLLDRLDREMDQAEKSQFMLRLAELRSAVLLLNASLVAKNELHTALKFEGSNPMNLMELNPRKNYLGEVPIGEVGDASGVWIFDPNESVMAYRPKSWAWLNIADPKADEWLKFKVVGLWSQDKPRKVKGVVLKALQATTWD